MQLKGLVSKPENNGKRATIVRYRPRILFSQVSKHDVLKPVETSHALHVDVLNGFGLLPGLLLEECSKRSLNGAFTLDSQGYLDDQQKYQASSLVWFRKGKLQQSLIMNTR